MLVGFDRKSIAAVVRSKRLVILSLGCEQWGITHLIDLMFYELMREHYYEFLYLRVDGGLANVYTTSKKQGMVIFFKNGKPLAYFDEVQSKQEFDALIKKNI